MIASLSLYWFENSLKMAALSGVIAGLADKLQMNDDEYDTETSKTQVCFLKISRSTICTIILLKKLGVPNNGTKKIKLTIWRVRLQIFCFSYFNKTAKLIFLQESEQIFD